MSGMRNQPLAIALGFDAFLIVQPKVLETIRANVGGGHDFTEAGGILIGSYRGIHIDIVDCTVPHPADVRRRTLFDRKDKGHHDAAMAAWRLSGRTDTFVGEWHTHPEYHPSPSWLDRRTWARLNRRSSDPLVFCIAGWRSTWWGLGHGTMLKRLIP
ncbi:MAG: Mov34/MPN/PAD-1 family protein [Devosia sp.]|uniref:Mov34/MPN/PAD-1 family protein n=1 Tax=Devosia sp. TaxID=1871048 RepID=UPI001A50556D|nr:Mov34/MPN/PAD-1 family protein [Devosia sp.]MBL8597375.1 Mov34/MPN/PAD-1 family protein [Devosia sp.]